MKGKVDVVYVIDAINWRRPGVLEVAVSCKINGGDEIPSAPKSIPLTGISSSLSLYERRVEGFDHKTVTFLYKTGKPLPGNANANDDGTAWSMDVSLMQVPITCHPELKNIMSAGGGVLRNGEVDWPRYVNGKKNSWYGTTSFLVPSITVTKEEIDENDSPGGTLSFPEVDNVGYSVSQVSGGFNGGGSAGSGRKSWLLESQSLRKIGKQKQKTQVWRHGGVLGWADQIYQEDYNSK